VRIRRLEIAYAYNNIDAYNNIEAQNKKNGPAAAGPFFVLTIDFVNQ